MTSLSTLAATIAAIDGVGPLPPPATPPARRTRATTLPSRLTADEVLFWRTAADHGADMVFWLDARGSILKASAASRTITGWEPQDLRGRCLLDLVDAADRMRCGSTLQHPQIGDYSAIGRWRLRRRDGSVGWAELIHLARIAGDRLIGILRDATLGYETQQALAEAWQRLDRLELDDQLTGLPNRQCFLTMLQERLACQARSAVLFIDLDGFKPINDVHGHAVGDALLRTVADRLRQQLAQTLLVARLGADEFAVLLDPGDDDVAVREQAQSAIAAIGRPCCVDGLGLDISATIGISVGPRDGPDDAALLRTADIAMAHGKRAGGGTWRFFEPWMGDELAQATTLKNELRNAIATGQIVPYFQPLIRMTDICVVGFEVLARWEHPQRGTLPPALFLPLVEQGGLAREMFVSMITHACEAARRWPQHLRLSVNLSPRELQDGSLPDTVAQVLRSLDFDGARLEIEITEDALVGDSKMARLVLDGLRALGMTIALDDFGTGFSSLYHLRELPFDKIKIDKSFICALDTDKNSARYVAAIIGLGQALALDVTAEGIEDAVTMRRLAELGCTYGQGYLFGRPEPAATAERFARVGSLTIV